MNIMFFLKPKSDLAYIYDYHTLRQALEIMEYHKYSCVPILNKEGKYVGSITEGDLLWSLKELDLFNIKEAESISIMKIKRRVDYQCVTAESNMEDLIGRAMEQNFVPVIDDQGHFIGIITRRDIIGYCYDRLKENGFQGGLTIVKDYISKHKELVPQKAACGFSRQPWSALPYSTRRIIPDGLGVRISRKHLW